MAMLQSSSSFSSFSYGFTYDVFLNFRGTDTRYGFTGNLYKALCDGGVRTFIDHKDLHEGDGITQSLVKAIEESRILIPVFSKNYASSLFCLDELVHIIHRYKEKGCLVFPIFCDVEPSHVRHQTGSYGEALARHEERFQNNKENYNDNMKRLHKWKMALNQAANLSGHHFNPRNGYEFEFIRGIVKYVSNKMNHVPLHVVDYPVGLQHRVLKVNSLLEVGSNDKVKMLGIYGPGGMGKTTLAKAVYNFIAGRFECVCFLHNVRENSAKHGLEHLQKDLLSKIVGLDIKLADTSEGIPIIKQRLHQKKVLLILDDINKLKQLQALAGGLDWFGACSRVIVTTRDKNLLASHGIEVTYEIDELNKEEALDLLRWKAFKTKQVDSSYMFILNRAVNYAAGLPLALEILGSNLYGKHIEEWNSLLDRYERIPSEEIQKILRVSFDALEEDERSVFLDIACCFKGYKLKEVEDMLCAHYGQRMRYHIGVLVKKSLVKIIHGRFVTLHDLIEDMGKEIVRQESPKEPGKRSRLWFHEDIFQVLEENSGTSQIEIIHLDFPLPQAIVDWKGDEFKKMKNLKTLVVKTSFFPKPHVHLPNNLRVLEWHSLRDIPSEFLPKNLSICKLRKTCPTSFKMFMDLKVLHLDECKCLREISDVSGLQSLEEFSFQRCKKLLTIHDSIGFLNKLKILNAEGCRKLKSFPPIQLTSLELLRLSYCYRLTNFPDILGKMENLESIFLKETSIKELPDSFQNLSGLRNLLLDGFGMFLRLPGSILMMPKLSWVLVHGRRLLPKQCDKPSSMMSSKVKSLVLIECNLTGESLPIVFKWFANVSNLNLSKSNITILPECIKELRSLERLYLDDCKLLQEIRAIPPNLKFLSAVNCKSLSSSCRSMLLDQELHEVGDTMFRLPGTLRIPKWFEHQSTQQPISFWFHNKLPSISLFCTIGCKYHTNITSIFSIFKISINGYEYFLDGPTHFPYIKIEANHTYLVGLKLLDMERLGEALSKREWNHAVVTCDFSTMLFELKESRMHIFKPESSMEDILFTNPYKKRGLDDDDDDDDNDDDNDDDDDDDEEEEDVNVLDDDHNHSQYCRPIRKPPTDSWTCKS